MDTSRFTVAVALAHAAETISQPRTLQETLDAIVHAARTSLPEFGHVSISERHRDGRIETTAGTDQLPWDLDALQYELRQGPCVEALEHEPVVLVEHLRHEQRWPDYVPQAAAAGVRCQMGVRLFSEGRHVGGLNLYSTDHDEVDPDTAATARLLATHVGVVLGHVQQEHHLNQALHHRKVIGQAIGIVMERYRIDPDRAFQFLVRASSTGHVKLRDLAEELVASSTESYRVEA
ncbi:GAF and ANTAR domain-containing protein [Nocardioides sp. SOB77]|uniref:GAF and ANTAR domain-containing protein n=1 Tax=Nocardioides oceani TaxID=3058369 RepID=A0ABT8FHQ8_9ACTN|nr:GAF and ANTAR domain-containing protein [Nocardioides oceani]MDN4174231.1 GAF and ANTAR domain-containing protein [Nocardioides oceani]